MANINQDKFVYSDSDLPGITIIKSSSMKTIRHKFLDYLPNKEAEVLIVGTFNPQAEKNDANFFYSRKRNFLWKLLPTAFNTDDLRNATRKEKEDFSSLYRIAFTDLIEEIKVDIGQEVNYEDAYLDKREIQWMDVVGVIKSLENIKRVCFTRSTFADIPNMNKKVIEIADYCKKNNIRFQRITTPARFYSSKKQAEWTKFLLND